MFVSDDRVVERLDAERVACDGDLFLVRVIEEEGEHASQFLYRFISPCDQRVEECFCVAVCPEDHAHGGEFGADVVIVVEFAVVCEDVASVRRGHRLAGCWGGVDDAQASVPYACAFVLPQAAVVRAPMGDAIPHAFDGVSSDGAEVLSEIDD